MIQNSVEMEGHTRGQPRPDDRSQGESGQWGTVGESVSKIISPPTPFSVHSRVSWPFPSSLHVKHGDTSLEKT